jgi:hypothetical protein
MLLVLAVGVESVTASWFDSMDRDLDRDRRAALRHSFPNLVSLLSTGSEDGALGAAPAAPADPLPETLEQFMQPYADDAFEQLGVLELHQQTALLGIDVDTTDMTPVDFRRQVSAHVVRIGDELEAETEEVLRRISSNIGTFLGLAISGVRQALGQITSLASWSADERVQELTDRAATAMNLAPAELHTLRTEIEQLVREMDSARQRANSSRVQLEQRIDQLRGDAAQLQAQKAEAARSAAVEQKREAAMEAAHLAGVARMKGEEARLAKRERELVIQEQKFQHESKELAREWDHLLVFQDQLHERDKRLTKERQRIEFGQSHSIDDLLRLHHQTRRYGDFLRASAVGLASPLFDGETNLFAASSSSAAAAPSHYEAAAAAAPSHYEAAAAASSNHSQAAAASSNHQLPEVVAPSSDDRAFATPPVKFSTLSGAATVPIPSSQHVAHSSFVSRRGQVGDSLSTFRCAKPMTELSECSQCCRKAYGAVFTCDDESCSYTLCYWCLDRWSTYAYQHGIDFSSHRKFSYHESVKDPSSEHQRCQLDEIVHRVICRLLACAHVSLFVYFRL